METKNLSVTGMDCTGCETSITNALRRLSGVADCYASFTDAKVEVTFDPAKVGLDAITQAISEAGYDVASNA